MKTDDLISVLAANAHPVSASTGRRRMLLALAIGMAVTAALVFGIVPHRDLIQAAQTAPFWMKIAYSAWLGLGGYLLADRAARPGVKVGAGTYVVGAALAAIAVLMALDMAFTPPDQWRAEWIGQSAMVCPICILVAAVPIFVAIAMVMRGLAPTRLRLAGGAAGLLAGGMGAAVYALLCREQAALFVATWYTLGIAVSAGIGALLGPRVLRW